jgi:hypothetical protein
MAVSGRQRQPGRHQVDARGQLRAAGHGQPLRRRHHLATLLQLQSQRAFAVHHGPAHVHQRELDELRALVGHRALQPLAPGVFAQHQAVPGVVQFDGVGASRFRAGQRLVRRGQQ